MSKPSYFNTLTTINYRGKIAKNILSRVGLAFDKNKNLPLFYDYVIEDNMRPDQVAYFYYNDANLAWLIMLCNTVIDPHFDWPLTTSQFNRTMVKNYGSIAAAKSHVLYYKHVHLDGIISTDTYNLGIDGDGLFGDLQITAADYLPVYAYNFEDERNEAKRTIKLVDSRYVETIKTDIKRAMSN